MLSFLTPLIVATAPLCLPYCSATPAILRDTAGVKNKHNTQESINLHLCVLHNKTARSNMNCTLLEVLHQTQTQKFGKEEFWESEKRPL